MKEDTAAKYKRLKAAGVDVRGEFENLLDELDRALENSDEEDRRREIMKTKGGAVWLAFTELEDLIDPAALAAQYFEKPGEWLTKRLDGCAVRDKETALDENECGQLADAFRDIAKRLQAHADEIDAAKMDE